MIITLSKNGIYFKKFAFVLFNKIVHKFTNWQNRQQYITFFYKESDVAVRLREKNLN